jgi:hypothetical protein
MWAKANTPQDLPFNFESTPNDSLDAQRWAMRLMHAAKRRGLGHRVRNVVVG